MLNLTIKNIFYKKARSILTIMGIVVALQLYIVMSGIMNVYEKDINKQISEMAGKVFVQSKTEGAVSMLPLQTVMSEDDAKEIIKIEGINIEKSTMILYNEILPPVSPNMPPMVMAVGIEKGKESVYYGNVDVDGKGNNNNPNDIILGASAATWALEEHNAKLNDTITLKGKEFKIVGILPAVSTVVDSSIIMPIEIAQEIYSKKNLINSVIITAEVADQVEKLAKQITSVNNRVSASTMKEMQKAADEMLAGQRMFFAMINNTIVVVAIFMIMIIMVMAIHERKKEIGTLKAIGTSFPKILFMVMSESTILSVIGGLIALPISVLFLWVVYGVNNFSLNEILMMNDPKEWPMVVLVAVMIGIVSGIFPALAARKVSPLESIRYE